MCAHGDCGAVCLSTCQRFDATFVFPISERNLVRLTPPSPPPVFFVIIRLRAFSTQNIEPQRFIGKNLSCKDLHDKILGLCGYARRTGGPWVNALVINSRPRTGNWLPTTGKVFSKISGLTATVSTRVRAEETLSLQS